MDMDSWKSNLYGLPYPIYFYWYSRSELGSDAENDSSVMGNCPSILSIQYVPFLEKKDFEITTHHYDVNRFGKVRTDTPSLAFVPWVYRIQSIKDEGRIKDIGEFEIYKSSGKKVGKGQGRYWKNESRLLNYPYSFALLTDNLNPPLTIKYHLCKGENNKSKVKVRNTLSDRCSYGLYIEGYKGDNSGSMEAMVSGDSHELPCSSSAYSQWYASSKNSTAAMVNAQVQQSFLTQAQSNAMTNLKNSQSMTNQHLGQMGSILGGVASLSLGGMANGLINAGMQGVQGNQQRAMNNLNNQFANQQAGLTKQTAIQGALAQVKDLNSTPNTMVSMGSDLIYGYNKGGSQLSLYRYGVSTEYAVKLADYWALYGYKQNKIMNLENIKRNRYFYNHIKTIGCNLKSNGSIAKEHLETLKAIFDKGVTIWHVDRPDVNVGDYSLDNYEIEN